MIKSFKSKEAEKIFNREYSLKLPSDIQRTALRKLLMIHAAVSINDLRIPPANHLERLRGNRQGKYSIRINEQWRICFTWRQSDACEVEIEDYH
jgi:Plasmid maintenance system killer protein